MRPGLSVWKGTEIIFAMARVEHDSAGVPIRVWVSAHSGRGLDTLRSAVAAHLDQTKVRQRISLPAHAGRLRAQLYATGAVLSEACMAEGGWELEVSISSARWSNLVEAANALN